MRIDRRPVLALYLQLPPYRNLSNGDQGQDVEALQSELRRLGYSLAKSGVFDRQTQAALTEIWKQSGAKAEPGFNLETIMWLPSEQVIPKSCPAVGARVATGAVLAELGQNLKSLTLLPPGAEDANPGAAIPGADAGARVAVMDAKQAPIEAGQVNDPAFLAAFAASSRFKAWLARPELALLVNTQLAEPVSAIIVPPGAIYDLVGTRGCIFGDGQPVSVRVLQSEFGQAVVGLDATGEATLPKTVQLAGPKRPGPCR